MVARAHDGKTTGRPLCNIDDRNSGRRHAGVTSVWVPVVLQMRHPPNIRIDPAQWSCIAAAPSYLV